MKKFTNVTINLSSLDVAGFNKYDITGVIPKFS